MSELGPAEQRLLDGLWAGSGRTLVIAGPPLSGKSDRLQRLRAEVVARGGQVHTLRGEYRFRDLPFGAMESLDRSAEERATAPPSDPEGSDEPVAPAGIAFVPVDTEAAPTSRRRGGARGRGGGVHLIPPAARNPMRVEPEAFWSRWIDELREAPQTPLLISVDEAAFVDAESREVLLYLSDRARLRPIGLVLSLDSSVPSFPRWEERLLGHGDVDWVRVEPGDDPRALRDAREAFELLPQACRRVLGMAALVGGSVSEVTLSRVTRMNFNQLAEALLPAAEAGHIKLQQGRLEFAHLTFAHTIRTRIPPAERSEMHREIAEALAALNPEPSLERRLELARHYYEWYKGPNALRYLLEAAELTERLHAFDATIEALGKALECVPSLPSSDRLEAETEIRFQQVRSFAFAGLLTEAEQALREGISKALAAEIPVERLEEWTESLLPVLATVGPRPSLVTLLVEVAERSHEASSREVEILVQSLIARFDLDRGRVGKAREEARRAARLATGAAPGVPQAMALEAVGLTRVEAAPEEQAMAEKFLSTAKKMLTAARRYALEQEADAHLLKLQELRGEREPARRARERALTLAERGRNLPVELEHRLELAAMLLDDTADARAAALLRRARELTEQLHLVPPSPRLIRLWLLEGRYEARAGTPGAARDRLAAVAALSPLSVPARVRAEARLRLALLEASQGRDEAARPHVEALAHPELRQALRPEWREWLAPLEARLTSPEPQPESQPKAPGSSA